MYVTSLSQPLADPNVNIYVDGYLRRGIAANTSTLERLARWFYYNHKSLLYYFLHYLDEGTSLHKQNPFSSPHHLQIAQN